MRRYPTRPHVRDDLAKRTKRRIAWALVTAALVLVAALVVVQGGTLNRPRERRRRR
jgi:hypothetical protein